MSEQFLKAIKRLPVGFYAHPLRDFINGKASVTRRGTVKATIEIPIDQLGSPYDDLRAVLHPEDNKLIPVLLFVEPDVAALAQQQSAQPAQEVPK